MINTSFVEWKRSRGGGDKRKGGRPSSASGSRPFTYSGKGPSSPTGGVHSFSSMQRAERGASYRPPSEVGSVRSHRSTVTMEEDIEVLHSRVDSLVSKQEETNAKLDAIIEALRAGKGPVGDARNKPGNQTSSSGQK